MFAQPKTERSPTGGAKPYNIDLIHGLGYNPLMTQEFDLGDCISNARNVMGCLGENGRSIWVRGIGHMYVLDRRADPGSLAINLPVKNVFGGVLSTKHFKDITQDELLAMLEREEAEDFTDLLRQG